jgi:CHAT domain-containing protein
MHSLMPRSRRPWLVAAAIAAALSIGALTADLYTRHDLDDELVSAADALPRRLLEARLSGAFEHKPLAIAQDAPTAHANPWPLVRAAAAVKNAAVRTPSAENTRAAGIAHLLLGEPAAALDALSAAILEETKTTDLPDAIANSHTAALLNDLAAALYTRGRTNAPADLVAALEAAERAWRIKRIPEAGWNRALALEALALREEAQDAWNEYLAIEPSPEWASEGREHLVRLQEPRAETGLRDIRAQCEESLTKWSKSVTKGDDASAANAIAAASLCASELARTSGDTFLAKSVQAIVSARPPARDALVRGHRLYAEGRAASRSQEMAVAAEKLLAAETDLRAGDSDFALRACLYAAMAQYHGGAPAGARETLQRCFAAPRPDYPTLTADAAWARGLFSAAAGRYADALPAYQSALDLFTRTREWENVAALHNQLAIFYSLIGGHREAWEHRHTALELYSRFGLSPQRARVLLMDVARTAAADGFPLTAIRVQNAIVELAKRDADAFAVSNALQSRGRYFADAGIAAMARRDVEDAEAAVKKISDSAVRERASTNVRIARAYVIRRDDPATACALLEETIAHLRRIENPLLLPELYVDLARCQADQSLFPAAARSIEEALAAVRTLNANAGRFEWRRSHLDSLRRVRQAAIGIVVDQKAYDRAFTVAEDFDAQLLRVSGATAHLPITVMRDAAIVKYAVLPRRLMIWVIRDGRSTPLVVDVSSRALHADARAFLAGCAQGDSAAAAHAGTRLHRYLIAPVAALLPRTVVVVPDDFLATIPFAALADEHSRRYVVEDHMIAVARCAGCVDWSVLGPRSTSLSRAMLAVGNPWPVAQSLPPLPRAETEARSARERYPNGVLLTRSEATRQQFLRWLAKADVIHFAGHALVDPDHPDRSSLVLAGDDGAVTAAEIASADARHLRLVVLSACNSGKGRPSFGGPLTLADAFLRAGAKTVVATLWEVDDGGAQQLLEHFHEALQNGSTAAEALREAQLMTLQHGRTRGLVYGWATYQIVM